jgi:DNA-binding HxlR family transcriptional regulator
LSGFEKLTDTAPAVSGGGPLVLPENLALLFAALDRRWTPDVLYLLTQRPARFTELQQALAGISGQ